MASCQWIIAQTDTYYLLVWWFPIMSSKHLLSILYVGLLYLLIYIYIRCYDINIDCFKI